MPISIITSLHWSSVPDNARVHIEHKTSQKSFSNSKLHNYFWSTIAFAFIAGWINRNIDMKGAFFLGKAFVMYKLLINVIWLDMRYVNETEVKEITISEQIILAYPSSFNTRELLEIFIIYVENTCNEDDSKFYLTRIVFSTVYFNC